MGVHIPENQDDDAIPLFKLEKGIAKTSAGLVCSKMAGVDARVVSRAKEILNALKEGCPVKHILPQNNKNSTYQANVKSAIRFFLGTDSWKDATNEDLEILQEKVVAM